MKTTEQAEIIEFLSRNPHNMMITATAGSGKTTTLLWTVEEVFRNKVVVVVSFTKKVANNMQQKLSKSGLHKAIAINMHRIGFRFLDAANYDIDVREDKVLDIAIALVRRYHQSEDVKLFSRAVDVSRLVGLARVRLIRNIKLSDMIQLADEFGYNDTEDTERPEDIPSVPEMAFEALQISDQLFEKMGICDFDDMIVQPLRLNLSTPKEFSGIEVAMIDEVQDLNQAQRELFFRIINKNTQIIAAGDPGQAMFRFAGADADSLDQMREMMHLHGRTVDRTLTITFRCPVLHVEQLRRYDPNIKAVDGAQQGSITTIEQEHIQDYLETDMSAMLIARWNRTLINAALSLIKHGLKVKVVGQNLDGRIISFAKQAIEDWEVGFDYAINFSSTINAYEAYRINQMRRQEKSESRINEVVDIAACCKIFFREHMYYVNNPQRSQRIMGRTYTPTIKSYNQYVRDMLKGDKYDVIGMTIHKAKGSEAEQIFLLGADDMPYTYDGQTDEDFEEEKRITYVGYSRSQRELYLVNTKDISGRIVMDIYEGESDPNRAAMKLLGLIDDDEEDDDEYYSPSMLERIMDD